jgi:EAL domain-containing protein (putative c-di-GMP-specific phosphodiesterase class I)
MFMPPRATGASAARTVRIAMDDFGTGYSPLSYLQRFPFGKIKIDQSFVREMVSNPDAAAIVRAAVGLGTALGLVTLAEGVETEEQLALLAEIGCDEAQDYLFSRPLPARELMRWPGQQSEPPNSRFAWVTAELGPNSVITASTNQR